MSWDPAGLLLAAAGSTVSALNFASAWHSALSLGRTITSIIRIKTDTKMWVCRQVNEADIGVVVKMSVNGALHMAGNHAYLMFAAAVCEHGL